MDFVTAIVLAAGEGKRMKSSLAKVLHPVCGTSMIEHVLLTCQSAGIKKTVTVVGVQADEVKKRLQFETNVFAVQEQQLGTGDAVKSAGSSLTSESPEDVAVILCGDTPLIKAETLESLVQALREQDAELAVLTFEAPEPAGYGRILRNNNGDLKKIIEDKDCSADELKIQEVNAGLYAVKMKSLWSALATLKPANAQAEYYLTDIVEQIGQTGHVVGLIEPDHESLMGVNSRQQLAKANELMNQRNCDGHMENGVSIMDLSNTWIECAVEIGADTVILPFTVIRQGVKIGKHCEVGPFTQLRNGAVLEDHAEVGNFTEMKQSTLGSHSKAKHLSYIGDATIGENVNIGAGTITANYDGKHKHATIIKDGAHIGSNCTLVAPVTVGKDAVTGAGSVVLSGCDVADGDVVAGVPAKSLKRKKS